MKGMGYKHKSMKKNHQYGNHTSQSIKIKYPKVKDLSTVEQIKIVDTNFSTKTYTKK